MQLNHGNSFVLNDFILKNTMCGVMSTKCNTGTVNQSLYFTRWSASHAIKCVCYEALPLQLFYRYLFTTLHKSLYINTPSMPVVFLRTWQHTLVTELKNTEVRPRPYWNWVVVTINFSRLGASPWIPIYEFIACGHCNHWTVSLAHNLTQMLKLEYLMGKKKV